MHVFSSSWCGYWMSYQSISWVLACRFFGNITVLDFPFLIKARERVRNWKSQMSLKKTGSCVWVGYTYRFDQIWMYRTTYLFHYIPSFVWQDERCCDRTQLNCWPSRLKLWRSCAGRPWDWARLNWVGPDANSMQVARVMSEKARISTPRQFACSMNLLLSWYQCCELGWSSVLSPQSKSTQKPPVKIRQKPAKRGCMWVW